MEQLARYPINPLTVKAEAEKLLAGRLVIFDGHSDEGDYKAKHAAAKAARVLGCVERDTRDPRADPAPHAHDSYLRTRIVRAGSIARVLCSGEVRAGEEVQTAADGKAIVLSDGTAVGMAFTAGKDSIIEVELY
jgi:hypothetical protein